MLFLHRGRTFTHADMVHNLRKDPQAVLDGLTLTSVDAWHAGTGICGEAGELLDAVKKYAVYQKPIDLKNVVEEMGDLEFYMEQLRSALNITREEVIAHNVEKLVTGPNARYANMTYSDAEAHARADKQVAQS